MAEFEQSVVINRPVEEVFAFVSDLENDPPWTAAEEIRQTSQGPIRIGTTFRQCDRFLGRRLNLTLEVTGFEPNRSIGLTTTSGPLSFTGTRIVEPVGNDATRVTFVGGWTCAWTLEAGRATDGRSGCTPPANAAWQAEATDGGPVLVRDPVQLCVSRSDGVQRRGSRNLGSFSPVARRRSARALLGGVMYGRQQPCWTQCSASSRRLRGCGSQSATAGGPRTAVFIAPRHDAPAN